MARQEIVLIGAGSVVFTQVLVADFARTCPPGGLTLALVDTNPDALEVIARLVRRMVELLHPDIQVEASTDRRDVSPRRWLWLIRCGHHATLPVVSGVRSQT